jgi:membrane protein implicated in regulation of membrane protease activity
VLTLVVLTAGVLSVALVAGLVVALVFIMHIRTFTAETAAALTVVEQRSDVLAGHIARLHEATGAAAGSSAATG